MPMVQLRARVSAVSGRQDRGAVAVEFALIVPILLALVFGIIQFGFILAQQVSLNGASRSGARFGSVNAYSGTHTCGAVVQKVRDAAGTIGMSGDEVAVEVFRTGQATAICSYAAGAAVPAALPGTAPCVNASATVDNPDTLTVKAEFVSNYLVPMPIAGSSLTLGSTGSYQCEYNK